jgi:hypothetical protein
MRALLAQKFRGYVTILIVLALFHPQASALDFAECKAKLKEVSDRIEELKLTLFPQLYLPKSKRENYDVRIFGTDPESEREVPRLNREVQIYANRFLRELRKAGLPIIPKIHFVVEANKGAIAGRTGPRDADGKDISNIGPMVLRASDKLKVPGRFGLEEFKHEIQITENGPVESVIVYLPFVGEESSVDAFIIAHELSHLVLNSHVHNSTLWWEASSDNLAYMLTGRHAVIMPYPEETARMDAEGQITIETTTLSRDIRNPRIFRADQVAPSVEFFHDNSLVLSHAIYTLSQKFGRPFIADLVSWVNAQKDRPVPDVAIDNYLFVPPEEFLPWTTRNKENSLIQIIQKYNKNEIPRVRLAIQQNLTSFGQLFRAWAKTKNLSPQDAKWFESVLEEAQI